MNEAPAILRTLIIYAVIVPLALFIGYMLANPLDTTTFFESGLIALVLVFPLLLNWHQPLLILSWNLNAMLFFLPGRPYLWLAMAAASLGITVLQRATGGVKHLITVPPVTFSLVFLIAVVVFTAMMTGVGLRTFGSEVYGGHRYFTLLGGIMGYFALSSRRIPPEHATLYVALFFLSGLTGFITDLTTLLMGSVWQYIFLIFPANSYATASMGGDLLRFGGAWPVSLAIFSFMLAKYGLRGIFLSGKPWRWMVFGFAPAYLLLGGFRGFVMYFMILFALQFYLEGLLRTKLLPIFAVLGLMMIVLAVAMSQHLPGSIQRALSFLPIQVNQQVQQNADESLRWRLEMWKTVLPEVPKHLLVGKGYVVSKVDFDSLTGSDTAIHVGTGFVENDYMTVAGVYHNGPLSVVMTFGLWGVLAFVWFVAAGVWVLYRNYCYGDPALRTVNLFLLVAFATRLIFFLFIFGVLEDDIVNFSGYLGLGVALNGGVCSPKLAPARATEKYQAFVGVRAHLQPVVRRPQIGG
jgi:hypothetical protein